jgi:putative thiamine transport system permease protein
MTHPGRLLRLTVLAVLLVGVLLPILAGLGMTLRASFGLLPAIGADTPSLQPFRSLAATPGIETSLRLSLFTGVGSTVLALLLALGICARMQGRVSQSRAERLLTPILAVPHAAMAIGLAFLLAPSGWLVRLLSPWATGWTAPPDLPLVGDGWGVALLLGLVVKELPFLILVSHSALAQLPVRAQMAAGRSLGYGRGLVFAKIILPQLWPLIRLPVLVVQIFALSVVDMAVVLGPSNPPTLSVAVMRLFSHPDAAMLLPASAGAIVIAVLAAAVVGLWLFAEAAARRTGLCWLRRGGRGVAGEPGLRLASGAATALLGLGLMALVPLLLWSIAFRWSFPNALPESYSLHAWMTPGQNWGRAFGLTLAIAALTTLAALALAVAWLEGEDRGRLPRARWAEALIYLPLMLPQIGFLYGLNVLFLRLGLSGGLAAVVWAQSLFVFPYVMIALSDPWRALDPGLIRSAASLGAGPGRRLWAVKLPVLLRPILTAAAIGFAVSVAQYLPTLVMGAGRIATLTTEAVTLSSGSDRRIVGVYAVLQAALPFAAYALALALPRLAQARAFAVKEAA